MWLTKHAYLKLYFSAIIIQSHVRGFVTRQRFLHGKEHRAATFIQVCLPRYALHVVELLEGQKHCLCLHDAHKIYFILYLSSQLSNNACVRNVESLPIYLLS